MEPELTRAGAIRQAMAEAMNPRFFMDSDAKALGAEPWQSARIDNLLANILGDYLRAQSLDQTWTEAYAQAFERANAETKRWLHDVEAGYYHARDVWFQMGWLAGFRDALALLGEPDAQELIATHQRRLRGPGQP